VDGNVSAPSFATSLVALLAITNPIGVLPLYLGLGQKLTRNGQRRRALLVGLAVAIALTVSLLVGGALLRLFDVDLNAFKIAGGLVVAFVGWSMITAQNNPLVGEDGRSPTVVPLAVPLVAGPGAISLVITYGNEYKTAGDYASGVLAIIITGAWISVFFLFGPYVAKVLRPAGVRIVTRLFGLLLLAIAIQAIVAAIIRIFPLLHR
jgi:multiple antibiotic resistance protein